MCDSRQLLYNCTKDDDKGDMYWEKEKSAVTVNGDSVTNKVYKRQCDRPPRRLDKLKLDQSFTILKVQLTKCTRERQTDWLDKVTSTLYNSEMPTLLYLSDRVSCWCSHRQIHRLEASGQWAAMTWVHTRDNAILPKTFWVLLSLVMSPALLEQQFECGHSVRQVKEMSLITMKLTSSMQKMVMRIKVVNRIIKMVNNFCVIDDRRRRLQFSSLLHSH